MKPSLIARVNRRVKRLQKKFAQSASVEVPPSATASASNPSSEFGDSEEWQQVAPDDSKRTPLLNGSRGVLEEDDEVDSNAGVASVQETKEEEEEDVTTTVAASAAAESTTLEPSTAATEPSTSTTSTTDDLKARLSNLSTAAANTVKAGGTQISNTVKAGSTHITNISTTATNVIKSGKTQIQSNFLN